MDEVAGVLYPVIEAKDSVGIAEGLRDVDVRSVVLDIGVESEKRVLRVVVVCKVGSRSSWRLRALFWLRCSLEIGRGGELLRMRRWRLWIRVRVLYG